MTRVVYTAAMLEFLAATFKENSLQETTRLFNSVYGQDKTVGQIRSCLKNNKITCGRAQGELRKGNPLSFTLEQKGWIEQKYKELQLPELVDQFNQHFGATKTVSQVRAFIKNNKMVSGRTGRFDKGSVSWNAGMKGLCMGGNSVLTRFKPGATPPNHRPVGSERVNVDGYIEIKTAEPNVWRQKHRVEWEKVHGPIPAGHLLWFRDNNRLNCDPSNLMLVTRAQHAVVSKMQLHDATGEHKETVVLIADLSMAKRKRQLARKKRREGDRHENSNS